MNTRRNFIRNTSFLSLATFSEAPGIFGAMAEMKNDRNLWLNVLYKLADPVLTNLSKGQLKASMPVESQPGQELDRRRFSHLEALGRLLCGIAPWLEIHGLQGEEEQHRQSYADLSRESLEVATRPDSPDYLNFHEGAQPLVDAAFLAQALIRAPHELWDMLEGATQKHLILALRSTRRIKPNFNNWLLFSAMIETALCLVGEDWDRMRVDYALRQHEQWYKGDGVYGDGPSFRWDYYNSFVIQPMLVDIHKALGHKTEEWKNLAKEVLPRARRYASILERLISPDGAFPVLGRSIAYRSGVFQLLSQLALLHELPESLPPEQVRSALSAVLQRTLLAPGTFDSRGWLTIGLSGHQPGLGETYISTGSLYLCATGLLPLGLLPADPFWRNPPLDWTSRQIWSGKNFSADHALD